MSKKPVIREDTRLKVCLCTPMGKDIPSKFVVRLLEFINKNREKYILYVMQNTNSPVDKARNELVQQSLANGTDLIFFLDSDNICPSDTVDRLLKVMIKEQADLATGIYFQKSKPYYPIIREYKYGGYFNMKNPELGKIIKIDGCGMGCCIVKAEVFKKLEYPWFKFNYEKWGKTDIQLSEDLYFCRNMMEAGMKMVCDTGLISSHIGSSVEGEEYLNYGPIRQQTMVDENEAHKDLSEFTGRTKEDVVMDLMIGQRLMRDEWNEKKPTKWTEIREFYKQTENYMYDQVNWHFTERRHFDIEKAEYIEALKPKNVLDFGCGIGQNSIMLARKGISVTMADLDSKTLDFAKFRFDKHNLKYKLWKTDKNNYPPEKKYDVIMLFDVMEHLPKNILKEYVEKLIKLKHKETKIMTTITYGKTEEHPMHMNIDREIPKIIARLLNEVPSE